MKFWMIVLTCTIYWGAQTEWMGETQPEFMACLHVTKQNMYMKMPKQRMGTIGTIGTIPRKMEWVTQQMKTIYHDAKKMPPKKWNMYIYIHILYIILCRLEGSWSWRIMDHVWSIFISRDVESFTGCTSCPWCLHQWAAHPRPLLISREFLWCFCGVTLHEVAKFWRNVHSSLHYPAKTRSKKGWCLGWFRLLYKS